ncbi:glycosyltransferase [soil metagenome]
MSAVSVLTLVKNRAAHFANLVEGLRRSALAPAELIVVDMSDRPIPRPDAPFPVEMLRWQTDGLPLALARNLAAGRARSSHLFFLDVDCIPLRDCLATMDRHLDVHDALICADARYLGRGDTDGGWSEPDLLARARPHPVRSFPSEGVRVERNPGLFWSLAFSVRAERFHSLGGFDEDFIGYGGEDTDFGFRAARAGLPLLFAGGAVACHQYHDTQDPPVQHLEDIVRNANVFHTKWGRWAMEGWLEAFSDLGLVVWTKDTLALRAPPGVCTTRT